MPVAAEIAPAPVVSKDEQNVWPICTIRLLPSEDETGCQEEEGQQLDGAFHKLAICNQDSI
jgi:hypothetical protein